ncbi:hypothetical protein EfmE980_1751 [Enterococcus faecium E980]|nr:hypothetical protein EfmE980_1751 [Enterococcus faecium E980]KXA06394.1 hypothetical protein HMPREF3199_02438 [Enterococcus faecium]MBL4989181.1 hypothetical protein [Enterococcus lactis]MBL4991775.1 hypothetical protein [Enterococcus lactis]MBL4994342.1 hypothetical protein [Enterococcus lactis]
MARLFSYVKDIGRLSDILFSLRNYPPIIEARSVCSNGKRISTI